MKKLILAILAPMALLLVAAPAQAYHSALAEIEGEQMTGDGIVLSERDVGNTSGGALRALLGNGRLSADLTITQSATDLVVYARGGQECLGWPRFNVRLDGQFVGGAAADTVAWDPIAIPIDAAPGTHHIDIVFYNDVTSLLCERLLRIDKVQMRHTSWRAFPKDSIWNRPASEKGTAVPNPYPDSEWLTYGNGLLVGGGPCNSSSHDFEYRKPIYFAEATDPVTTNIDITNPGWQPSGDLAWDGRPVPVPDGVEPAEGTDGHLTIVSADRTVAFEFWRARAAGPDGITAATMAMYDLTGPGYSSIDGNNSARGSGMPVISNALRAEEAYFGFHHALAFDVPNVASQYVFPATKSDGRRGQLEYGQLFVLRPDFPIPANAPIGVQNVLQALKTYGAYIADQGSNWQIDTDSGNDTDLWCDSGVDRNAFQFVKPSDLMLVQP